MLGALHIEKSFLSVLGDWVDNSGWTVALSSAKVTLTGNQSLVSEHDVAKTKYSYQVTACALHQLIHQCFNKAIRSKETKSIENSFLVWKLQMGKKSLQFQFGSSEINPCQRLYMQIFNQSTPTLASCIRSFLLPMVAFHSLVWHGDIISNRPKKFWWVSKRWKFRHFR